MLKLIIANKNYSSWSMRPWVLLKHFGIPFEEELILLGQPDTSEKILKVSLSGRVPALSDADITIWDSLAICEYVAEKFPQHAMWPHDRISRAMARSFVAEMHSGFAALRQECTMNIRRRITVTLSDVANADVARVNALWQYALQRSGGPFLFGDFSIADTFFAPVVTRFRTYGLPTPPENQLYMQRVLSAPGVEEWVAQALVETAVIAKYEP